MGLKDASFDEVEESGCHLLVCNDIIIIRCFDINNIWIVKSKTFFAFLSLEKYAVFNRVLFFT